MRNWLIAVALFASIALPASAAEIAHFTAAITAEPDTLDITSTKDPGGSYVVLQNIYEQLWRMDAEQQAGKNRSRIGPFRPTGTPSRSRSSPALSSSRATS